MNRLRWVALAGALTLLTGCPRLVPQDSHSGKDARPKGARTIKMEDGAGEARDIVTYPGGDRVDWKVFEVKQRGDVRVQLSWRPPRPGLQLAFNVLDEAFHIVKRVKPARAGARRGKLTEMLTGLDAGKYYVQIYAPTRGDAGAYTVDVRWREGKEAAAAAELADAVPLPPRLAAVPEPPDPAKIAADEAARQAAEAAKAAEDAKRAEAEAKKPKPKRANITEQGMAGSDVIITIDQGKEQKVDKGWSGYILRGSSGNAKLPGSDFTIMRCSESECVGRVSKLSLDEVGSNTRVMLVPPAEGGEAP